MIKTKNYYYLSIIFCCIIQSCSPKLSSSWTKKGYTGDHFTKIAVVGISDNLKARNEFEKTAVKRLVEEEYNAIEGIDIFPPKMIKEELTSQNIISLLKENQIDAILTISLIDTKDGTRYEYGEEYTVPFGYYRVGKYIVRRYETIRTPGYYVPSKSYVLEAVLYNLKGEIYEEKETIVWTGQSSLVDPSSIESAAHSFTKKMVHHLIDDMILKK